MNRGLTLTSLMVAVALSGVLAVAGTRLVVNQMNTFRVLELKDKGESIFEFYSNLLHDDKVWWCTLYDNRAPNPNKSLRDCVLKNEGCSGGGGMRLVGPDCEIQFKSDGSRDFSAGKFTPGTELIGSTGKPLKDSVLTTESGGWWEVKVAWEHKGSAAVDLVLTQTFNESLWQNAPTPSAGKRYLPELQAGSGFKLRVRRSADYVPGSADVHKAVTAINLHTANRTVQQHDHPLVDTTATGVGNCHQQPPWGQVVKSVGNTNTCSGSGINNRVAVTPTDTYPPPDNTRCHEKRSVIAQIGVGPGTTDAKNVRCALDGSGKMVRHRTCARGTRVDRCPVPGGPTFRTRKWSVPQAISSVSQSGTLMCEELPSWPAITSRTIRAPRSWWYPYTTPTTNYTVYGQGEIGRKGYPGRGPRGHRGPAWNDSRCSSS